ncbi:MAG: sugar ABC transporter substrate-binding protein [Anaerolineae bacterium]|nr:sugar ABC transporter substrate-binding protein [Anaerolineae bacterium]
MAENKNTFSRRSFLRKVGQVGVGLAGASVLAACATPTPQVIKETVVVKETVQVEKPVEKVVKETVVVAKEVGAKNIRVTVNANFFLEPDAFEEAKVWTVHVPEFNATRKDIKIIVEPVSGAEYYPKVPLMAQSGDIPDVLWASGGNMVPWAIGGILLAIDDLAAKDKFDLSVYDETALKTLRYETKSLKPLEGPLWGLSQLLNPGQSTLYWNADVFAAKGVALPQEGKTTIDDLVSIAKQLTQDKTGDGKTDVWGMMYTTGYGHSIGNDYSYIAPFGGEVITRDGTKCVINSPQAVQGFQFYYDLIWTLKVAPPQDVTQALGNYKEMHMKGQVAMYKNGPWGGMHFLLIPPKGKDGHVEAGGIPFPKGPSGKNGALIGLEPWSIAKATKYPAEAFEVLKWITDKESGKIRAKGTMLPPLRKDAQQDPDIQKNELISMNVRAAAAAELPYFTANGRDTEVNRLLGQEMAAINTNAAKPDQAFFDALAKKVQEILDKPRA